MNQDGDIAQTSITGKSNEISLDQDPENEAAKRPPSKHRLKLLLVMNEPDPVCDSFSKAAHKLGFEVFICTTDQCALTEYQDYAHDLVIIDTRYQSFDTNLICRSIRNTRGNQHTVIIAIVRKTAFERDDVTIASLLDSGIGRCIIESTNVLVCVNELILIKHNDVRIRAEHATCQALYAALDKCKDMVIVTDNKYKSQYTNAACKKQFGFNQNNSTGKNLQDQFVGDDHQLNEIESSLLKSREWYGRVSLKKENVQETTVSSCKAVPYSCSGKVPTHFIFVFDAEPTGLSTSVRPRSIEKDIMEVLDTEQFMAQTSFSKFGIASKPSLTQAREIVAIMRDNLKSNPQLAIFADNLDDILKTYKPAIGKTKSEPGPKIVKSVISDLISALVSPSFRQRYITQGEPLLPLDNLKEIPTEITNLLEAGLTWEFNIIRLEALSQMKPLEYLGMKLFNSFDVSATLNIDKLTLVNWLRIIEANYHSENAYHNSTHGADVMQAVACFLTKNRLRSILEPLDVAVSLIAAAAHDLNHPGKSSAFLSNTNNPLAILYNDVAVLESHHAALCFKLTLSDEKFNIFKNLDTETYKYTRHTVIDMILATEMTKHFDHLATFVEELCNKRSIESDIGGPEVLSLENIILIQRMMIKCADVSNPTRPLRLCVEWATRIAQEYFKQTEEEKALGVPVIMPMFDRLTCSIPKSQLGFVDFIIVDVIEAWNAFLDMPELVTYMRQNYLRWKEFEEQGYRKLEDIRKLQATILAPSLTMTDRP